MILSDFLKAIGQIGDPGFRRVLVLGLGLTVALLFGIYAVFLTGIVWITPDAVTLPWIGTITWVDQIVSGASIILMLALSVFLMVPVAAAFTGFFLEDIADAVETRHYPDLGAAPRLPFSEVFLDSLSFLGVLVGLNILALGVYLIVPPFAPFVFWGLNGYLLGREYFQMTAMRWIGRDAARAMRARYMGQIWVAGLLMAIPLSFPLINLLVPILGAATFTHLFHRLKRQSPDQSA